VLDGRYRFDNFVVGASNRVAVSAARAVAENPGAVYNPLVVQGAHGLGKTHLLTALGHAVYSLHRSFTVEYLALESFVERFQNAASKGNAAALTRGCEGVHLLLLDDVQFLSGHMEAQSEILRLFTVLQDARRQLVMTADRPPSEIAGVDQLLLTRMSGGLLVDISLPDYETRLAIVNQKSDEVGLTFEPGVLEEVANAQIGNVRELEDVLAHVAARQATSDTRLTVREVRAILAELHGSADAPPGEYDSFLGEIAVAVSLSVDQWRVRLEECIARWSREGFRTDMLERALNAAEAPDIDTLEANFEAAVSRLRALEAEAVRLDRKLAGLDAFRNPERVVDAEAVVMRALVAYEPPPAPNPDFTIQSFVAGERNQVALRGASEVIAVPGSRYNPLYVFGASSAGKTHLLHAIGNALAAREGGSWTVACVSGSALNDELIRAMQEGTLERWRMRYRAADALIVDDVQALVGKERAQEELLHLFNALHASGKQVILGAHTAPAQLVGFAPRLRSRFQGGLVVEIGEVPASERLPRRTPVSDGVEAAAPISDAWFSEPGQVTPPGAFVQLKSLGGVDSFFLDPEKCVAEWPGIEGRVTEDHH
jgi:chromosomal replication initiation ATPase DnaA